MTVTVERTPEVVERLRRDLVRPVSLAPSTFLPEYLYHYTTASGLAGIVADKAIRATNFSFMNDPSELQYGRRLVEEATQVASYGLAKIRRPIFTEVVKRFDAEVLSAEVYVSCFTRLEDDLSQWRSYWSASIERYSLGFDSETLAEIGRSHDNMRFTRILYDENEQYARLAFVTQRVAEFIERECPTSDETTELINYTAKHLARLLPMFKNPAYQREEEWRLILWETPGGPHAKFDTARGVLRPFREIGLPLPVPLRDVCLMAPSRRDIAIKATRMLLKSANLSDTTVRHSVIPFAE
jgi:hypothetical protein